MVLNWFLLNKFYIFKTQYTLLNIIFIIFLFLNLTFFSIIPMYFRKINLLITILTIKILIIFQLSIILIFLIIITIIIYNFLKLKLFYILWTEIFYYLRKIIFIFIFQQNQIFPNFSIIFIKIQIFRYFYSKLINFFIIFI